MITTLKEIGGCMKVVIYRRVSTGKQAQSGLGLEAQKEYCDIALNQISDAQVIGEYVDAGISGALPVTEREGLRQAIELCNREGACLLVAKLDRLSRSVKDIAGLIEELPCLKVATMMQADKFQLHLFAALAEQEKDFIKERTKAALTSLKARAAGGDAVSQNKVKSWSDNIGIANSAGVNRANSLRVRQARAKVFSDSVEDNIIAARSKGCDTLQLVADYLNQRNITTIRGAKFTATAVKRVEDKIKS